MARRRCWSAGANRAGAGAEMVATQSTFYPEREDVMGWDISEKGFQIVLSPNVPEVIREHLGEDTGWIPGGPTD